MTFIISATTKEKKIQVKKNIAKISAKEISAYFLALYKKN